MSFGIKLHVWGDFACFTRQEMKAERVSYDVMTPSAARGVCEAIHWKPAIRFVIDRIHVLRPIRFQSLRRNEVALKMSVDGARSAMRSGSTAGQGIVADHNRLQRASTLLVGVAYVIEAHFELTAKAGSDDTPAKHICMFNRRAEAGQFFHQPCLGTREFPAAFRLLRESDPLPESSLPLDQRNCKLGWMLHDIDFENGRTSRFFRAHLVDGVLDVRRCLAENGVAA